MKTITITIETKETQEVQTNSVAEMMRKIGEVALANHKESIKYRSATACMGFEKIKVFLDNFEQEVIPLLKELANLRTKMGRTCDCNLVIYTRDDKWVGGGSDGSTWGISLKEPSIKTLVYEHGHRCLYDVNRGQAGHPFPSSFIKADGSAKDIYYCATAFELMYGERGFVNRVDGNHLIEEFKKKILKDFEELVQELQRSAKHNKSTFETMANN